MNHDISFRKSPGDFHRLHHPAEFFYQDGRHLRVPTKDSGQFPVGPQGLFLLRLEAIPVQLFTRTKMLELRDYIAHKNLTQTAKEWIEISHPFSDLHDNCLIQMRHKALIGKAWYLSPKGST